MFVASMQQNLSQPVVMDSKQKKKLFYIVLAIIVFAVVNLVPIAGVSVAGHRALAVAAMAVVLWISEAVELPLSALIIMVVLSFSLGFAPDPAKPEQQYGLTNALKLVLSGWAEEMVWFMLSGVMIAIAMEKVGLDRRIALWIVSRFKTASGVLIGTILAMDVLAFFMPPVVARTAAMVPIVLGIIRCFDLPKDSKFAAMIGAAMATAGNTSAYGLLSGGGMNPLVASFVQKATGHAVSYTEWMIWWFPYTLITSVVLFYLARGMFKPETETVPGGREALQRMYTELGPWTKEQIKVLTISLITVFMWVANGKLFTWNLTAISLAAVVIFLSPWIGAMDWKEAEKKLPWGTFLLFAAGISLGMTLVQTGGAKWLADVTFVNLGIAKAHWLIALAVFTLGGVLLHFGFSSSTSLCATYIPVVIGFVQATGRTDLSLIGIPIAVLSATGFTMLVVNTPNTMIAFNSGTFTSRQFTKLGIWNAVLSFVILIVYCGTYLKWVGGW